MKKQLFLLLFIALTAYGQGQTSVAVLPSDGDAEVFNNDDLEALTNKMRSVALETLPSEKFALLTQEVVIKRLGGEENFIKECRETACIVDLGKKAQVDYIAQASVGKLRDKMRVKVEVYEVSTSRLVGMYDGNGEYFYDYFVLLDAVGKNVPNIFKKIPGVVPDLVVEKPELAKIEPVPAKPEVIVVEKEPSKTKFWVAIGLDVLGAGMLFAGYLKDKEMVDAYYAYNIDEQDQSHYNSTWDDVERVRTQRNLFYILGGVFLASGIGVHIWF